MFKSTMNKRDLGKQSGRLSWRIIINDVISLLLMTFFRLIFKDDK